jgi:UDP-glucose 4-epimerase
VLVTGGAGFVGSHVVDRLCEKAVQTRVYDLRPPLQGRADFHHGDLRNADALEKAMRGCEAVVHLAAMADVDAVERDPAEADEINVRGTLKVLQAARAAGVRRVVYASTIWVYSDAESEVVDEDAGLRLPRHIYSATKLAGEMYCRSYAELYGLEYTILRLGIPYGPRSRPEAVLPAFVRKALKGESLTVAGNGRQSRRFVFVEDLAEGVVAALAPAAANRVYNLVGSEEITVTEVAEAVQSHIPDVEVTYVPGRQGDFHGAAVSGERAARELGWRPTTEFVEGVRRYLAWYLDSAPPTPAHRRERRPLVAPALFRLTGWAAPATLSVALFLMAGLLHAADAGAEGARSVVMVTVLALSMSSALSPGSGETPAIARWLLAATAALLVVIWPEDLHRLEHADVDLVVQVCLGAAVGWIAGTAGPRLLRTRLSERI